MSKAILLVDDDPDYLMQTRLQLEAAGYTVHAVESAEEAETWLETNSVDLALVDLMMGTADAGFTLCHRLKQAHPDLPVVMVTAVAAETGLRFDTQSPGEKSWIKADAVLNKPIRVEQLEREMKRLIKA